MKYSGIKILAAAAALIFCGSCTEDVQHFGKDSGFVASLEKQTSNTKTTLDNGSVLWSEGDAIRVFSVPLMTSGYAGVEICVNPADKGSTSGRFYDPACEDYCSSTCYAVYPSAMCTGFEGSSLKVNLPAVQYYRENSFDAGANPSVAVSSGNELSFLNLCGLLAVSFNDAPTITEITLTTLGEEALWGEGKVDMTFTDKPALVIPAATSEEQKTITLKIDNPNVDGMFLSSGAEVTVQSGVISGDAAPATVYYIVVPAGALEKGFALTAKCADGSFMKKVAPASVNTILRSTCIAMPALAFEDNTDVEIRTDVPNKAFYKDLLMDTGIGMSDYKTMPVTDYLNLSTETFYATGNNATNQAAQNKVFCGNPDDLNGILLYPDGEPRYKMIYVNGGIATTHGRSWMVQGRENIRTFFFNGGSYVGSCAGAFVSTYGVIDSYIAHNGYMGLWPGYANNTSIYDIYPDYILPEDSPLLKYYDFGGDHRVAGVKHWNGPYFEHWDMVPGTEVLCINDYPAYRYHMLPSVIAYKPSIYSGRVIPSGGHPEQEKTGEKRDLMAAYCLYAMDGVGIAKVKGILRNGEVRSMTKSTSDEDPAYTKIGDKQCHHFVFAVPDGAKNIKVRLEALDSFNLSLRLAKGTFAFKEDAQYKVENTDLVKELTFPSLEKGTWYIGVQCEDTVNNSFGTYGITYSGKTAVLNGVPYKISVSWE